jgi:predicted regulator of Ras-like GTPase activity (Roadblock/LC7/MglB family)
MFEYRAQALEDCLRSWALRVHEIRALTLADRNGLPLVSTLGTRRLEESLAAAAGSVLAQATRLDEEFETGPLYLWHLAGRDRQVFVTPLTAHVALAAIADAGAAAPAVESHLLAIARELLALVLSQSEEKAPC